MVDLLPSLLEPYDKFDVRYEGVENDNTESFLQSMSSKTEVVIIAIGLGN